MVGHARLDVHSAFRAAPLSAPSTESLETGSARRKRVTCPDRETCLQAPPIVGTTETYAGGIVIGRHSFAAKFLLYIQRLNQ